MLFLSTYTHFSSARPAKAILIFNVCTGRAMKMPLYARNYSLKLPAYSHLHISALTCRLIPTETRRPGSGIADSSLFVHD